MISIEWHGASSQKNKSETFEKFREFKAIEEKEWYVLQGTRIR